jgi:hypothetical protein
MNICACVGPIGEDVYCPCEMVDKGLTTTLIWTTEKRNTWKMPYDTFIER